jgi:hypothetical protein
MLTEIEVIVAGERQQATPVALDPNSRSRGDRWRAAKLRAFQRGELVGGKFFQRTHPLPAYLSNEGDLGSAGRHNGGRYRVTPQKAAYQF